MEDSTWKGAVLPMTCCAATSGENPNKRLGTSQLPSCKLTLGAIFKCTTQCWKSCGVDNLEQMTKTDNFGTTWVENVNRASKPLHQCYLIDGKPLQAHLQILRAVKLFTGEAP